MDLIFWKITTGLLAFLSVAILIFSIRANRKMLSTLQQETQEAKKLLDIPATNPNPVMRVNKSGELIFASTGSAPVLTGWNVQLNDKIPAEWREIVRQVGDSNRPQTLEMDCGNNSYLFTISPKEDGFTNIYGMDITPLKQIENDLRKRKTVDELTNLPNRVIFLENLEVEVARAKNKNNKIGIVIIRIDDYFQIVNTYGEKILNEFVVAMVDRIGQIINKETVLARLADNQFGLVVSDPLTCEPAVMASYMDSFIEKCAAPYKISDYDIVVKISAGIALYPKDAENAEKLVRNAQLAVNRTSSTQHQYEFFQRGLDEQLQVKRDLISDLYKAVENKEFQLYYQPQIDIKHNKMIGCESLIRWNHPQKGFVSPFLFITLAEETKLIVPIGEWVLREACRQIVIWREKGYAPIKVAVNVSASQILHTNVVELVTKVMKEMKITKEWLSLELTESALVRDKDRAIEVMTGLKHLGLELALDDFGTGYSSLSYLMQFPIDKIKIDRSFIIAIEDEIKDGKTQTVAKGIIDLGHSLGKHIVAEGVETPEQLKYVKENNCDIIQGYYFSKPQPPEVFEEFFSRQWSS